MTYLNLEQNKIGDQGAQHLGEALKTNRVSSSFAVDLSRKEVY